MRKIRMTMSQACDVFNGKRSIKLMDGEAVVGISATTGFVLVETMTRDDRAKSSAPCDETFVDQLMAMFRKVN